VIAGQGTVAMEILRQHQGPLDAIFVPVGGGGLIAGIAAYVKYLRPEIRIIGVESEHSACLQAALQADQRVVLPRVGTFADGVAVAQIGAHGFEVCRFCVDEVLTVSNDELCAAIKNIYDDTRSITEPSGALAVAGIKKYVAKAQPAARPSWPSIRGPTSISTVCGMWPSAPHYATPRREASQPASGRRPSASRLLFDGFIDLAGGGPDSITHLNVLGHVQYDRQLAVIAQHESVPDHRHEILVALAIRARHEGAHRADDFFQAVERIAPTLKVFLFENAAQALPIAVDFQGLSGKDLDLIIIFTGLRREVDNLAGKAALRFGKGRDFFKFCCVRGAGQRGNYQPNGGVNGPVTHVASLPLCGVSGY
jgi:hypothetical protein